jgi:integrase
MTLRRGPYRLKFPEGSVGYLIEIYRANSPKYKRLAPRTRYQVDRVLDAFRAVNGKRRAADMTPQIMERMRDMMSDTPAAANQWARVIGQMLAYCKRVGLIENNPLSEGLEKLPPAHPGGFRTWREDEIEAFEVHYPAGSVPRLAFALALYTGAAAVDLCKLGQQNLDGGRIRYRRQKTERRKGTEETPQISIPVVPALAEVLALAPANAMTFLQTEFGRPRSEGGLNHQFRAWVDAVPGLDAPDKYGRRLTLHGLRKALATRLASAGASDFVIMAWLGHETIASVQRYTKAVDRVKAADAGAALLGAPAKPSNVTRIKREQ